VTWEKKGSSTRGVEYPMAKMLIRESIVSDNSSNGNGDEESKAGAQDPDDVLAFSRSVHKSDSSVLEWNSKTMEMIRKEVIICIL